MARKNLQNLSKIEDAADEEILAAPVLTKNNQKFNDGENQQQSDEDEEDEEENLKEQLAFEQMQAEKTAPIAAIFNKDALLHHAKELTSEFPWVETLETCEFPLELENVHDDLKREVAFYNNTLEAVKHAKKKLAQQNIPYKRPEDYFAEMLKSDAHMAKVKDKLIYEQKKINAVEERKKSQAHKKVAKKVQNEKLKQRSEDKKNTLEAVKEWKKKRAGSNNAQSVNEDNDGFEEMLKNSNKRKREDGDVKTTRADRKRNFNRENRDKKFGHGGKKKYAKSNTKSSTNDMKSFSLKKNNDGVGKRGKKASSKRPGKSQRDKKRSGRN